MYACDKPWLIYVLGTVCHLHHCCDGCKHAVALPDTSPQNSIDLCPPQVFEGYGQTECTVGATLTLPGDFGPGHVGPPLPCNLIKLVNVPDMNYFAANGEGEVSGVQLLSLLTCWEQKIDSTARCPPVLPSSGLLQGSQRVPGLPEGRPEDPGGTGRGRVAALGRHRQVAAERCTQDHRQEEASLQTGTGGQLMEYYIHMSVCQIDMETCMFLCFLV